MSSIFLFDVQKSISYLTLCLSQSLKSREGNIKALQILLNIILIFSVIILIVPRDELRTYMLRAAHLGMTDGDYQFLFTDTRVNLIVSLRCVVLEPLKSGLAKEQFGFLGFPEKIFLFQFQKGFMRRILNKSRCTQICSELGVVRFFLFI